MGFSFDQGKNYLQTRFNAAIPSLERIHNLLQDCNNQSRLCFISWDVRGNQIPGYNPTYLKLYKGSVISFYNEVDSKLSKAEIKEIHEILHKGKDVGKIFSFKKTQQGKKRKLNTKSFTQHWEVIHEAEVKLRRYCNKYGILMPDKASEADAADL